MKLMLGDCLEAMRGIPEASVDAVVCDPPAGIAFMGKAWDRCHGGRNAWITWLSERLAETRRVSKPGSYMLCWAIPRTSHWTGMAIEEAGWIIRDRVSHLFGTGFPKSKACLKPACEDWWLAWNPTKKVGALNIGACRISSEGGRHREGETSRDRRYTNNGVVNFAATPGPRGGDPEGRWPANVVLSHHESCNGECHPECPVRMLGDQSGERGGGFGVRGSDENNGMYGFGKGLRRPKTGQVVGFGDSGTAARFLYTTKASRKDRGKVNTHPTVKSTDLMRWLCRLITPSGGTVLDPFMGSGSTGVAALREGFDFIGIEREAEYMEIARQRLGEPPDDDDIEGVAMMPRVSSI